jgi:hypothetical protein
MVPEFFGFQEHRGGGGRATGPVEVKVSWEVKTKNRLGKGEGLD